MALERELCVENLEEPQLQREVTFGRSYRILKEADQYSPIKPKHSPINAPFKLCRASQRPNKQKKKKLCKCSLRSYCSKQSTNQNMSLLDRSILTQDKYMELLSTPQRYNKRKKHPRRKFKVCCKCKIEPCPPRIIQMSIPKKRYVLANWKTFEHLLPTEMLLRFDQILKSGNNLEPTDARYYFKQLQRKKRREIRRRKRLCKKMKKIKRRGERMWMKNETEILVREIVCYIKHEPLFMLNFHQMMTSNELLTYLCTQKVIKITTRNTRCVYKKTMIEISDKLVKWMDAMNFFVDVQPLDSKEKLVLQIPSLESLLEEEIEEEEEEEISEEEKRKLAEAEEGLEGLLYGEGEGGRESEMGLEEFMAKKLLDKIELFDQEHEGEGFFDFLGFDEDTLEKLIKLLSESPPELLLEEIDSENLPGVTYGDILEKLKLIRDGNLLEPQRDQLFLEERMVEWAKNNDPERVDDKILDKIHETSTILLEWFKNAGLRDFKKGAGQPGVGDMYGLDEFGEEMIPIEELFGKDGRGTTPVIIEEGDEFEDSQDQQRKKEFGADEFGDGYGEDEFDADEMGGKRFDEGALGGVGEGEGLDEGGLYGEGRLGEDGEPTGSLGFGEGEGFAIGEPYGLEGEREGEGYGLGEGEGFGLGEGEGFGLGEGEGFGLGEGEGFGEGFGLGEGEGLGLGEGEGFGLGEGEGFGLEEEGEEEAIGKIADELERLDSLLGIIRGHKPSRVFEHEPGTICCLSLKIWAVWLLEIANNAHSWTKWIGDIIKQVRYYASVIRGDVLLPNGEKKVLYKEEWRKFVRDTEEKVVAWRQYSAHVKDLSNEIMENFHGKPVKCCPKCLQDHLIKNVVTAHETLQALTEAINCASYWQRCLDKIVQQTSQITDIDMSEEQTPKDDTSLKSEESYTIEILELPQMPKSVTSEASYETVYELEELITSPKSTGSDYEIVEMPPQKQGPVQFHELEELTPPSTSKKSEKKKHEPNKNAKPHKSTLKKKR